MCSNHEWVELLCWVVSPLSAGTRPIVTRTVKAPTTKPTTPTGNLQKLPVCDKCGNGIVWVKIEYIICDSHSNSRCIDTYRGWTILLEQNTHYSNITDITDDSIKHCHRKGNLIELLLNTDESFLLLHYVWSLENQILIIYKVCAWLQDFLSKQKQE